MHVTITCLLHFLKITNVQYTTKRSQRATHPNPPWMGVAWGEGTPCAPLCAPHRWAILLVCKGRTSICALWLPVMPRHSLCCAATPITRTPRNRAQWAIARGGPHCRRETPSLPGTYSAYNPQAAPPLAQGTGWVRGTVEPGYRVFLCMNSVLQKPWGPRDSAFAMPRTVGILQ